MPPFGTRMHRTRRDPPAAHRRVRHGACSMAGLQFRAIPSNRSGFPRPIKARRASRWSPERAGRRPCRHRLRRGFAQCCRIRPWRVRPP